MKEGDEGILKGNRRKREGRGSVEDEACGLFPFPAAVVLMGNTVMALSQDSISAPFLVHFQYVRTQLVTSPSLLPSIPPSLPSLLPSFPPSFLS
jgi:hypothetical protein